jgi:MazG family protein
MASRTRSPRRRRAARPVRRASSRHAPRSLKAQPKKTSQPAPPVVARDAGQAFRDLVAIMQRLRGPNGCPWDREQSLESLRGFVLEETYEVLDAIDRGDRRALCHEIGDLLFEGVFLAQIGADERAFTVVESLRSITGKLIRRHPHVFGPSKTVETPTQVLEQWEQIKAREQTEAGERRGVLAGVPKTLPALLRAHEIGTRVAAVGFDWSRPEDVVEKIEEEVAEFRRAIGHESPERAEEEMGDLLFSVANLCRKVGIEPESALRKANEKFSARFAKMERRFEARGRAVHGATLDEMEAEWQSIKAEPGY